MRDACKRRAFFIQRHARAIAGTFGCTRSVDTLLYILLAVAIGFALGRSQYRVYAFQNRGETRLSSATREHFCAPDYHLMNHITLRLRDGTTQIDHILVSRFGVFVIETKDYKGWIFANDKQTNWTQVLFKQKFEFQNPIFQNLRHIRAVQALLDFPPPENIKSIVVFTGEAEFKTEVPHGVFSLSGFIDHVHEQTTEIMSLNRVQFCVGRLETARLAITGETDVEHAQNLERRHGSTA
jgi:Nuclease-related domain